MVIINNESMGKGSLASQSVQDSSEAVLSLSLSLSLYSNCPSGVVPDQVNLMENVTTARVDPQET